jgi:hypothetical protein
MAYERVAQTDIAELQRLAASLTPTPPSGYERNAQTDLATLTSLTKAIVDPSPGGYERVGTIDVAALRRKILQGAVVVPPSHLNDGDIVTAWSDSSGLGHNAAKVGLPIFKVNILNGKPVVRFRSASQDGFNLASNISGAGPFTVLAVFKTNSAVTEQITIASTDATPYGPAEISGVLYVSNRANYVSNTTDYSSAFHVILGSTDGAGAFTIRVDGADKTKVVTALVGTGDFSTIGWRSTGPLYSDGDIAEIVFYNTGLSGTDVQNLEKGLGVKYGISVVAGSAVQPDTVAGLQGWWKADSLL